MSITFKTFRVEIDSDQIALIRFDVPSRTMNTITADVAKDIPRLAAWLSGNPDIKGAVLTSGKDNGFCAGADLGELGSQAGPGLDIEAAYNAVQASASTFRALECCGKPIVCALNGTALGGGLELALATHRRIATDTPSSRFGFPEATIGLLPGGGGTQRLPRMIGVEKALPLLLEGTRLDAASALAAGLLDEVVAPSDLLARAKDWLRAAPESVQPWDRKGYRLPGGLPHSGAAESFLMGNALVRKKGFGNYPGKENILKCVYEGVQVPIEAGLRIEARYFVKTLVTPQARAMVRTLFDSMQQLAKGGGRPSAPLPFKTRKAAVLGAGMMGAGIAFVQATAGIETLLFDVSLEAAERGKDYSRRIVEKDVQKGRIGREKAEATLARIIPATDYALIEGADIVIEAVFEDRALKADVTRLAEAHLSHDAIFGSNTSTLRIGMLAEASERPENFIGVHFFSPVDRMNLVEIIVGEKTSEETLAKAIDYVLQIRKTPIIVNDNWGFYTSRCFGTYINEGLEMLLDGIAPAIIDNLGRATGMPRGPLELCDDVAIDLLHKVRIALKRDMGSAYHESRVDILLSQLVEDHERFGRKNGKGFYDYPADGGAKQLWGGLADLAPVRVSEVDDAMADDFKHRLLFRQSIETVRCVADGVISDPRHADVGALLGWGFPSWTGGPLSLVDSIGTDRFVEICDQFCSRFGSQFEPPELLLQMAARGLGFYGPSSPVVGDER